MLTNRNPKTLPETKQNNLCLHSSNIGETSTSLKFDPSVGWAIPHTTEHSVAVEECLVGQWDTLAQLWFQVPRQNAVDVELPVLRRKSTSGHACGRTYSMLYGPLTQISRDSSGSLARRRRRRRGGRSERRLLRRTARLRLVTEWLGLRDL